MVLAAVLFAGFILTARAEMQFDVFLGYDGVVPDASWFPIICEVKNDGPPFTGVIEVSPSRNGMSDNQTRSMMVELPTGTLKRLVIPVFSSARFQSVWDVRLLDERGRSRAEQLGLQPKRQVSSRTVILGAIPRTPGGAPVIRQIPSGDSGLQPETARFQTSLVPDNPLVFEGLSALYLNSERAVDLTAGQVEALLGWLNDGGHLIVAVEAPGDVNAVSWLKRLIPCDLGDQQSVASHPELQNWVREQHNNHVNPFANLPEDPVFEDAALQVATGPVHDGTVLVTSGGVPLMLEENVGRGRVTTLLFSPEREPARSWKNLPTLWARLADVPSSLYSSENVNERGGWSVDGVFGAMIDSRQVRKLPVEWLLVLLIVYLVVIGPLDQYWLKRIKRPMLTWLTFPCYVVLFSLLIYFIGYKLRAGESEWNELHVVDVLDNGGEAELRGHTYASIYSPVGADYRVESDQHFSAFRGEFQSSWVGSQEGEKLEVLQAGDNYKARISVPVWTSQLYVSDWWESANVPIECSLTPEEGGWAAQVVNRLDRPLTHAELAVGDRLLDMGDIPAGQSKTFHLKRDGGTLLRSYVQSHSTLFQSAASARRQAFGETSNAQINDDADSTMTVSFLSQLNPDDNVNGTSFVMTPGLDMESALDHGNAVLQAWCGDYSPINPINKFTPLRSHKDTLWRITVPLPNPQAP
jgi:hypothetical protein